MQLPLPLTLGEEPTPRASFTTVRPCLGNSCASSLKVKHQDDRSGELNIVSGARISLPEAESDSIHYVTPSSPRLLKRCRVGQESRAYDGDEKQWIVSDQCTPSLCMAFNEGQPYVVGNSDQTEVEVYAFDPHPRVVGSIHDWVDKRRNKEHVDHVFPPFWRLWMLIMLTHTRLYTRFESGKELFRVLNIYKLN